MKRKILYILLILMPLLSFARYSRTRVRVLNYEQIIFISDVIFFIFLAWIVLLISIPFFIKWSQKQKVQNEILLYQIRGKFTYFNVLLWLEHIENHFLVRHNFIRKKLETMRNTSIRNKGGIAHFYRADIERMIFNAAFGKRRRINAYKRMAPLTKFYVAVLLAILFIPAFYAIPFWYGYEPPKLMDNGQPFMLLGILMALITSLVMWLMIFYIFNFIIYWLERYLVRRKGHAGYLHIISAQLDGFFKGIWYRSNFPQAALMKLSDITFEDKNTEVVFEDFEGGSSKGNW